MKTWTTLTAAAATLLTFSACESMPGGNPWDLGDDTGWGDTGYWDDTDDGTAPLLSDIDWSCDPSSGTWYYYAQNDGWAGAVTLDIHETGSSQPWSETHELSATDYGTDEYGDWDVWELTLNQVSSAGSQQANRSTLYQCGYHSNDSLTWMFTVYDENNQVSDCAVWGHQPSYWTNRYSDCLNWN